MSGYQSITIVGRLGKDPEMRYMPDGTGVTNFNVAVDVRVGQGQANETAWFRVSVWGKQAESANQYLAKGREVLVEGVLRGVKPSVYQRNDGTWDATYEIKAHRVVFLGGRGGEDQAAYNAPPEASPTGAATVDDMPF